MSARGVGERLKWTPILDHDTWACRGKPADRGILDFILMRQRNADCGSCLDPRRSDVESAAEWAGWSVRAVRRALGRLEKLGIVKVERSQGVKPLQVVPTVSLKSITDRVATRTVGSEGRTVGSGSRTVGSEGSDRRVRTSLLREPSEREESPPPPTADHASADASAEGARPTPRMTLVGSEPEPERTAAVAAGSGGADPETPIPEDLKRLPKGLVESILRVRRAAAKA